ncbi:dihydroorotate dehydrogenase-like protein [Ancylomarina longa]|uniref:dihydrouracil dehydrogenase (NAD(+)) n=1 Tax=Ancylomarina longa TaxID=2487017 RepID=A0A434AZL7_9BACT|nr:dihydroorotate dehydrogenase-like protein [Ancylomarina longa]RUT80072.1 dihydroorotate dehydrogenase-like protein [Ancylomarina longa]
MINLETTYMGLRLKNPLIVSSSGLTNSVRKIKIIEEKGAGAVVLKSLFEEQITNEVQNLIGKDPKNVGYPEAEDYIQNYVKGNSVAKYLSLIKEAKAAVSIPVIASINCVSSSDWTHFAKEIEKAGADAIELNVFVVPNDRNKSAEEYEKIYFDIFSAVKKEVNIPISMKIGIYFTNLFAVANRLNANGADALVLFNRFYEPDIDIDNLKITSANVLSSASDIRKSLRFVGMISDKVKGLDISASTGIHDGEAAIKQILAGAKAVQICSTVYEHGFDQISIILEEITAWMKKKEFKSVDVFRGKLSYGSIPNSSLYERAQFMKYFSGNEKDVMI